MRFELTTTDLEGRGTTSCATEMSKMIPKPINISLPRSDLAEQTDDVSQESPTYFSKLSISAF